MKLTKTYSDGTTFGPAEFAAALAVPVAAVLALGAIAIKLEERKIQTRKNRQHLK